MPEWPILAYVFLVAAVIFAMLAAFLPWFLPVDPEGMNDEPPTLNTRSNKGD